jgi:hypothetical protein
MNTLVRLVLLSLSFLLPAPSVAQAPSVSTSYYQNPQPDTISGYIQSVDKNDAAAQNKAQGSVIGFMSEVFRANPDRVDRWLSEAPLSKNTQVALVYALWLADMHEVALQAMRRFHWAEGDVESASAQLAKIKNLDAVVPNTGNDLDMFWGAFFASGDKSRIDRILFSYNYRARNLQIDSSDILLAAGVMGTRTPDPTALEKMKQFKSRYGDQRSFGIIVAATALWGLGSNFQQHDRVRDIVMAYLRDAIDDQATRTLARYVAQASTKVIGPTSTARVFFLTTGDPNFATGPMKDLIDQRKPPKVDKVFGKSATAFAALTAWLKAEERLEYQVELSSPKGGIRRSSGRLAGTPTSESIQSAMIPLSPEPPGTSGLYELLLTVSGTETSKQSFRTLVYFDEE